MNRYSRYAKSEKGSERSKKYKDRNRDKIKARNIAYAKYPEPSHCIVETCMSIPERHHPDYTKPELIVWTCREHHHLIHYPKRHCVFCDGKIHARSLCKKHYARGYRKQQGW